MQAAIKELVMQSDYLIDSLDLKKLLFELIKIRLQDFEEHVIKVVFAELQHLMASPISLSKHLLNIAFLGRLVNGPGAFQ